MPADYAITFFYYPDIAAVAPFYEDVLGFELVLDQGMARIYRVAGRSYFGIVDGNRGHLRHQPRSAVLLTIVAEDVAADPDPARHLLRALLLRGPGRLRDRGAALPRPEGGGAVLRRDPGRRRPRRRSGAKARPCEPFAVPPALRAGGQGIIHHVRPWREATGA